ncbi:MAG: hypothetical protein IKS83_07400 [Victivallales bacterium]|nr:hypothetical protein [Victivallales bacterium]
MWSHGWRCWTVSLALLGCVLTMRKAVAASPELVVCWGNSGDIPAVALLEPGREPRVLLPGGSLDGGTLAWYLGQLGKLQLAEVLMPTWAPFPRGAASLAKKCSIRQLTVVNNPQSRLNWADLRKTLTEAGTALVNRFPTGERYWRITVGDWFINFQQLKRAGTFRLSFSIGIEGGGSPVYYFEQRVTGVFVVGREGRLKPILEVPKSNRRGVVRIRLEEPSDRVIPVDIKS